MAVIDDLIDGYVSESEVDFISLPQLVFASWRWLGARSPDEARAKTLDLIRRLYERGLRPGDYQGADFAYWSDEGCQGVLDRIEREWIAAGEEPNLGEPICWFAPQQK
jgi:hypothetical protein